MKGHPSRDGIYFLERPSDAEVERLIRKYGKARESIVTWNQQDADFRREMEDPLCYGQVVLLIHDAEDRLALVRGRGSPPDAFDIPTGIIEEDEGVEEAALREGHEESGSKISIESLTGIYRVQVRFAKWDVERWFFALRCTAQTPSKAPKDTEEIEEVRFVRLPDEEPEHWKQDEWWGGTWRERILKDAAVL